MWEGIPNHHGWHLSQEPHSLEKMDSLPGGWPEFALLQFPLSMPMRNYPECCLQFQELTTSYRKSRTRQKHRRWGKREQSCFKLKRYAGRWMADAEWEAQRNTFLEHSFIFLGSQGYFALGPNVQSCNRIANDFIPLLHLTLSLHWNEHPCIAQKSEWVSHTREKEHLVNAVPGIINWAHYKANQGALQFHKRKKDSARIQGNCEGTGESDIKPGETPEFQVQQETGYLEQDVTGQRKPFAPPTLHWAPSPRAGASEKFPSCIRLLREEGMCGCKNSKLVKFDFTVFKILPLCRRQSLSEEDQPHK